MLAGHTRWQILEVTVKRPEVVAVEKRKPTVSHLILKRCSLVSSSLYLAIFVPCFESVHDMKPLSSVNASALLLITTTHTHTDTQQHTGSGWPLSSGPLFIYRNSNVIGVKEVSCGCHVMCVSWQLGTTLQPSRMNSLDIFDMREKDSVVGEQVDWRRENVI